MTNVKKICIIIAIIFIALLASFGCGYGVCRYRYKHVSGVAEIRVGELESRCAELESELTERIAEIDRIQSEFTTIGSGIDECLSITGDLRGELQQGIDELRSSSPIFAEIRKRIIGYENQIQQLQDSLRKLQESSDKQ